jgi:hypothetical protein
MIFTYKLYFLEENIALPDLITPTFAQSVANMEEKSSSKTPKQNTDK